MKGFKGIKECEVNLNGPLFYLTDISLASASFSYKLSLSLKIKKSVRCPIMEHRTDSYFISDRFIYSSI